MQGVNKKRIGAYDRVAKHLNQGSFQFNSNKRQEGVKREASHQNSVDSSDQRQPKMNRRIIKVSRHYLKQTHNLEELINSARRNNE